MPPNAPRGRLTIFGDSALSFTFTWVLAAAFLFWPALAFAGAALVVAMAVWWLFLGVIAVLAWTGRQAGRG
jgi:hypothetical protein